MKSRLALLAALSVLITCLVAATAPAAQAASFSARLSRATPIVDEVVQVKGTVAPAKRPVQLQAHRSGHWVRVASSTTRSGGAYALSVRATATSVQHRVYAPAARINGKRYRAVYSNGVWVHGVQPRLVLSVASAPVGPSSSDQATRTPGVATFTPARPGAAVTVQRFLRGSTWTTVATGTQNAGGNLWIKGLDAGSGASPAVLRAVSSPGSGAPTTYSSNVRPRYFSEVFQDTFTVPAHSRTQWGLRPSSASGKRLCAVPDKSMYGFGGATGATGVMWLAAKQYQATRTTDCRYGKWHNASVTTANGATPFTPTHGVFAARIKFQSQRGAHGAFWLQAERAGGSEIDVVEYFGDGNTSYFGLKNGIFKSLGATSSTEVSAKVSTSLGRSIFGTGNTPSNGWHVYSVEWTPGGYVFRVDGIATFRTTRYPSQVESELILSLLTSDWELPALSPKAMPKMQVDWVRGWQAPASQR